MARYTLEEAQVRLLELCDLAVAGAEVVIAAPDRPELELRPSMATHGSSPERTARSDGGQGGNVEEKVELPEIPPAPKGGGPELLAWLDKVRVGRIVPGAPNAAELVRQMRDEGY